MADGPTWPRSGGATEALKKLTGAYKDALEEIATGLARREHAERVLVNHVQEADRIIEVSGKKRRNFWWCHEIEAVGGGLLVGLVPSSQEWLTSVGMALFGVHDWIKPAASGATIVVALTGIFLICHAWFRSIGIFAHPTDPLARPKTTAAQACSIEGTEPSPSPEAAD